jgi:hypothetical protein
VTEAEWLDCADPMPMLALLRGKGQRHKFLRFVAATLRHHPILLAGWQSPRVLEVVERCADAGQVSPAEWGEACRLLACAPISGYWRQVTEEWDRGGADEVDVAAMIVETAAWAAGQQSQADLLREVFGNPFRPVPLDPAWLAWHGGAIPALARAVYEEGELRSGHLDAAHLAVLADMLEEGGCAEPQLLRHLRGPGPHVRGCWAVDALLGKL